MRYAVSEKENIIKGEKVMKTKNLKKALSLFLAVLMIALAIPFTFMTVSADEADVIEIESFTPFGNWVANDYEAISFNKEKEWTADKAHDGNIESDAQTYSGDTREDFQMCYFNEGVMTNGANTDEEGKSYYGIFVIELSDKSTIDTLSLWTPYLDTGVEADRPYMANNGYDIYYSADGQSYTAVDNASFSDVYAEQSTDAALYETGTYNNKSGRVHNIALDGVTAKYIAIAVSDLVAVSNEHVMIFSEIVVHGTPTNLEINSLTPFGNWVVDNEPICFRNNPPDRVWTEDKAYDGYITSDAQTWPGADRDDFVMTHFDANGGMKQGPAEIGTSYFGIFVVELKNYARIDELSLWTPYVGTGDENYMANNGYDIYYSADGESYTAVDGASFTDVYAKQSTADALYVAGNYNGKDGHVHNIDMGGVEAKYIAIAVSDLAYDTTEMIFSEIVVHGASTDAPKGNIEYFTPYGADFASGWGASHAFDGNIKTEAQTDGNTTYTTASFENLMSGTTNADASGKSYYGLFEIELYEVTEVSSLSLWTSYYDETEPEFMSNNGYDIYYSADGVSYSAVKDATFSDVFSDRENNGYYVESMYGTNKGHVHDIDMRDVKARYIVIAVSETVYNNNKYMIFWDVAVHGTPAIEVVDFDVFGRHSDAEQTELFFSDGGPAESAFDGNIGTEAQSKNGSAKSYEMCYFDADGKMKNGKNASGTSYYGIFIAELSELAEVDTLSLWGSDTWGFGWMSNDGYDIYYSIDGESYNAAKNASFKEVCSKQTTDDPLYVEGTYNRKDGYVHNIDMGGVTAKYIAIAVSTPAYGSCGYEDSDDANHEMIFFEIVVSGGVAKKNIDKGASVRMTTPTGIRFTGTVARSYYDRLVKDYGEDNVKMGILITPTEYLNNVDEFTKDALDAWNGATTKYLEIDADAILADGNTKYRINCAMVNIKTNNVQREFSARLYVKVTNDGETEYLYSGFSKTSNSRSIELVASLALSDVQDTQDGEYKNSVTVYGQTKYSPYDTEERKVLESFSKAASSITVMTYNIQVYDEKSGWGDLDYTGWGDRNPVCALDTIVELNPDVVGLQEDNHYLYAEYSKVSDLSAYTRVNKAANSAYADGNSNEGLEILFKTDKFTLIEQGVEYYKALAKTAPYSSNATVSAADFSLDKKGNEVSDEYVGRFFRWVILKDKNNGEQYLVINTHWHHTGDTDETNGVHLALRKAQATILRLWLVNEKSDYSNQIVMGDLNCQPNSQPIRGLSSGEGALSEARTYANYIGDDGVTQMLNDSRETAGNRVLDHVLYSADSMVAVEYSVIDNYGNDTNYSKYPSDHLPVYAKFIAK